ncbi:hypothetical protein P9272_16235 [Mesorhizobium sp. WSM4976]|jgi:hypothetical protein|nr:MULTISPECIES: hypothetical protein [unclassified Mesorhizobium]MDG4895117.1 hypothetical protein [Mesorhizobium sp. WSM4976]
MKRPIDRLPAMPVCDACFARLRDSGAGKRLRGEERGACGC